MMSGHALRSLVIVNPHETEPHVSEASIVGPQDGEVVLPGPIQVRMIEDGSGTAPRLAVAVLTVPPRTDGPPPHWHQQHDETFYVIAGTARFTVGDTQREAPAGTFVSVPKKKKKKKIIQQR